MNRDLKNFIRTYLQYEQAYDTSGYLRPTLMAFSESFVEDVRIGLSEMLRQRSFTVGDYERLTDIEFPDEDTLYEYLRGIYAYLFEGLSEQPSPPE